MTTLLALLVAVEALAAATDAIPWQDAEAYVGEERTVEGTVVAVRREGNVLRITFDANPSSFSVAVIGTLFSPLPSDPAALYEGRMIRATGKIRSFRGVSEMMIRDPSQITVTAAEVEPSPTAPAGVAERLERLENRVERLERRLVK
jgi:DNA/RNA endonuclease YhcR with UshA esterase domain